MSRSQPNKPVRGKARKAARPMTVEQHSTFLRYYAMGSGRSVRELHASLRKESEASATAKVKVPALDTLEMWSGKYGWQALVARMDEEANEKLYAQAVGAAKEARVDILKLFRAVVLRFAMQIKDDKDREITSSDIQAFWRMARVEMNLPTDPGGSGQVPSMQGKVNPDGSFDFSVSLKKYESPDGDGAHD